MSSKIIEQVEQLNKKITQISNMRVEAEAESKMLLRNLKQGIEEYEKKYGVSLKGKNFDEIAKLVMEEYNTVKQAVEEEYALSSKVVDLIEKGNVKEAKALLEKARAENWEDDEDKGTEVQEKATEKSMEKPVEKVETVKAEEKMAEPVEDDEDEGWEETGSEFDDMPDDSVETETDGDDDEVDFGSEMSMDDDDFEEPTVEEPVKAASKEVKESKSTPVVDDDDEDDMDFGFNFGDENEDPVNAKKEATVKEEPKAAEPVKEKKDDVVSLDNAFSFDDDDNDDNGDFMGFGKILSGSKFEV